MSAKGEGHKKTSFQKGGYFRRHLFALVNRRFLLLNKEKSSAQEWHREEFVEIGNYNNTSG